MLIVVVNGALIKLFIPAFSRVMNYKRFIFYINDYYKVVITVVGDASLLVLYISIFYMVLFVS